MKKSIMRSAMLVFVAMMILIPGNLCAQSEENRIEGRWTLTLSGGLNIAASGDVLTGGTGTLFELPTTVNASSYNDVYGLGSRFRAAVGYGVWEKGEILGIFSYGQLPAELNFVWDWTGFPLFAQFDTYSEFGIEGGYRHYFMTDTKFKPYAAVSGGIKWIQEINFAFLMPGSGFTLTGLNFYESSVVPTIGGDAGIRYDLNNWLALGGEIGIHYNGAPERGTGLAGTGLENVNDTGSLWYVPILFNMFITF